MPLKRQFYLSNYFKWFLFQSLVCLRYFFTLGTQWSKEFTPYTWEVFWDTGWRTVCGENHLCACSPRWGCWQSGEEARSASSSVSTSVQLNSLEQALHEQVEEQGLAGKSRGACPGPDEEALRSPAFLAQCFVGLQTVISPCSWNSPSCAASFLWLSLQRLPCIQKSQHPAGWSGVCLSPGVGWLLVSIAARWPAG